MASCEHCWDLARRDDRFPDNYREVLKASESNGSPCCECDADGILTENAQRLRAGQFWDEATKTDRRMTTPSAVEGLPTPEPRG